MEHHAGDWTPSHHLGDGIAAGGGAHAGGGLEHGWQAGLQASGLGDASRFDASSDVRRLAAGLEDRLNQLQAQTDRIVAQATLSPGSGQALSGDPLGADAAQAVPLGDYHDPDWHPITPPDVNGISYDDDGNRFHVAGGTSEGQPDPSS